MPRAKTTGNTRKLPPALSPEARENQMIALAMDLAEKQLMEGTASSQVITHFLKIGTAKFQYECQKLQNEAELLIAKKEDLETAKKAEERYAEVIAAMKKYSGHDED